MSFSVFFHASLAPKEDLYRYKCRKSRESISSFCTTLSPVTYFFSRKLCNSIYISEVLNCEIVKISFNSAFLHFNRQVYLW